MHGEGCVSLIRNGETNSDKIIGRGMVYSVHCSNTKFLFSILFVCFLLAFLFAF
jgi:hypothetical protein